MSPKANTDGPGTIATIAVLVIAALVVLAFFWGVWWVVSLERVGEGDVGVVTERGAWEGEIYEPGWEHHNPLTHTTHRISVRPQTIDMTDDNAVYVITQDGQDVWVDVTVRYRVDREQAGTFFTEYRDHKQARERLIYPTVRSDMRDVASDVSAREIITREGRETLAESVQEALTGGADGSGIIIEAVQIRDVKLNEEFSAQLEQVEIENTEQERALIEAETDRKAKIVRAEGQAESEIIRAEAEAEAMEIRDAQITENILILEQIGAYDEGTVFVIENGAPVILDPENNQEAEDDE